MGWGCKTANLKKILCEQKIHPMNSPVGEVKNPHISDNIRPSNDPQHTQRERTPISSVGGNIFLTLVKWWAKSVSTDTRCLLGEGILGRRMPKKV